MKSIIAAVVALSMVSVFAAEPVKTDVKVEKPNCVKKDKAGKCPAAPKGTKPTPKKKSESK